MGDVADARAPLSMTQPASDNEREKEKWTGPKSTVPTHTPPLRNTYRGASLLGPGALFLNDRGREDSAGPQCQSFLQCSGGVVLRVEQLFLRAPGSLNGCRGQLLCQHSPGQKGAWTFPLGSDSPLPPPTALGTAGPGSGVTGPPAAHPSFQISHNKTPNPRVVPLSKRKINSVKEPERRRT